MSSGHFIYIHVVGIGNENFVETSDMNFNVNCEKILLSVYIIRGLGREGPH